MEIARIVLEFDFQFNYTQPLKAINSTVSTYLTETCAQVLDET